MSGQPTNLPEWIVWVQALAVPLLGLFAAWIAYQQWRTADRKVQLDLFDRRFALYEAVSQALRPVLQNGAATLNDASAYDAATDKIQFLFSTETVSQFQKTRENLSKLIMYSVMMKEGPPYNQEALDGKNEFLPKVIKFYINMPELLAPYMRLDHKIGRPFGWVGTLRIRIGVIMERRLKSRESRIEPDGAVRSARERED